MRARPGCGDRNRWRGRRRVPPLPGEEARRQVTAAAEAGRPRRPPNDVFSRWDSGHRVGGLRTRRGGLRRTTCSLNKRKLGSPLPQSCSSSRMLPWAVHIPHIILPGVQARERPFADLSVIPRTQTSPKSLALGTLLQRRSQAVLQTDRTRVSAGGPSSPECRRLLGSTLCFLGVGGGVRPSVHPPIPLSIPLSFHPPIHPPNHLFIKNYSSRACEVPGRVAGSGQVETRPPETFPHGEDRRERDGQARHAVPQR